MACPSCQTLIKGHIVTRGTLCDDCNRSDVRKQWETLGLMSTLRQTIWAYTWLFPILLAVFMAYSIFKGTSIIRLISQNFVPWGFWAFSVFWLYPHHKMPKKWKDCEDKAMNSLFVAKIARPDTNDLPQF